MTNQGATCEQLEISPQFRLALEERVRRLERDADYDEAQVAHLEHPDHVRRQVRLVVAERTEALRIRLFLDRARLRASQNPVIFS